MVPGSLGWGLAVLAAITDLAAPRAARKAIARPMPRLAPVINKVLPARVAALPSLFSFNAGLRVTAKHPSVYILVVYHAERGLEKILYEGSERLNMNVPLIPIRCLYRAVDLYGKKKGVVSGSSSFTYSEFGERCERLAVGLLSEGVRPGDRVAYLSFNNHQLLEGYYGPPLIRAIAMPLNVRLQPAELTTILNHAGASMLVFENEFAPLVQDLRKTCPSIRRYVAIDQPVPQADLFLEDLLARGRIARPDLFSFDENEIAELFYTSGSTGTPKGVTLSHRTLYLHALAILASFPCKDTDVELHTIPLFHANGWGRPPRL